MKEQSEQRALMSTKSLSTLGRSVARQLRSGRAGTRAAPQQKGQATEIQNGLLKELFPPDPCNISTRGYLQLLQNSEAWREGLYIQRGEGVESDPAYPLIKTCQTSGVQWGRRQGDWEVFGEGLHRWQGQAEAEEAGGIWHFVRLI